MRHSGGVALILFTLAVVAVLVWNPGLRRSQAWALRCGLIAGMLVAVGLGMLAVRADVYAPHNLTECGRDGVDIHVGECELHDGKLAGIAVVVGARIGSLAGASQVLVSQTVKDLVAGSGLAFDDRGEHELKGVPDRWRLFAVIDRSP